MQLKKKVTEKVKVKVLMVKQLFNLFSPFSQTLLIMRIMLYVRLVAVSFMTMEYSPDYGWATIMKTINKMEITQSDKRKYMKRTLNMSFKQLLWLSVGQQSCLIFKYFIFKKC